MSILDGFTKVTLDENQPFASFTENGLTFSKNSVELLGAPAYVELFINADSRQFAIKAVEGSANGKATKPKSKSAIHFYNHKDSNKRSWSLTRWNNKTFIDPIEAMLPEGTNPRRHGHGVRIKGTYYPEENCIIYDCNKTYKTTMQK